MYESPMYMSSEPAEPKHSGFGIASFVVASITGILVIGMVAAAGMMEINTPGGVDEKSPVAIILGLGLIGGMAMLLLGLILGVIGLCQDKRKKVFAVLGMLLNFLIFAGLVALIIFGLSMQ